MLAGMKWSRERFNEQIIVKSCGSSYLESCFSMGWDGPGWCLERWWFEGSNCCCR